jgi:transposase
MASRKTQQNTTLSTQLSLTQLRIIADLISGASMVDAAEAAGVDRSTIYRWKQDVPAFAEELCRARNEIRDRLQDGYRTLGPQAIEIVAELLRAAGTPPSVRLKAAMEILQRVEAKAV